MKDYRDLIEQGRRATKFWPDDEFRSDQQKQLPQPPLAKEKMTGEQIKLPDDFGELDMQRDFLSILDSRMSHRIFTGAGISLLQLSFLLWATQGVKGIRGDNYATLRTVPCGGGRHEFESYFIARNVTGLRPGAYHYLPLTNEIEFLCAVPQVEKSIADSLAQQQWAQRADVVFYWSMVPYRAEWRYGIYAHRIALVDLGHIGENMYLAAEALKLGTCGVGAFDRARCNELFGLDGEEEYVVYTQPVGTVDADDREREQRISISIHDSEKK